MSEARKPTPEHILAAKHLLGEAFAMSGVYLSGTPSPTSINWVAEKLRALEEAPAFGQWQPIDTCPYETWVLMWFVTVPLDGHKAPDAAVKGQRSAYERGKFWDGHIFRPMEWVTHWMPLPSGPTTQQPSRVDRDDADLHRP